jgi:nucleoside 2-deoxyribosyltransferase
MKIYFANSLLSAPEEFKIEMLEFREKLKNHHEILEYFGKSVGSAQEVFCHDIECVKNCDMVVAEVSYPSHGVGIEITTALHLGKQVIAIAKQEATVSRMVLGITDPNFKFIRYSNIEEIIEFLPK